MFVVFFFKQKTAYEMLRSLVGSEMCIRDRLTTTLRVVQDVSRQDSGIETLAQFAVRPGRSVIERL